MAEPAQKRATYQDVLGAPEHLVAEVVEGVLHTAPRPAPRHARAGSAVGGKLFDPFDEGRGGPGGWWLLFEPELHLAQDIVVPDWAGWRRERLPKLPEDAYFTLAPDWVCEVLSPATARFDRTKKLPLYARERVPHVWLIDPQQELLEVLLLDGATYRIVGSHGGDDLVRAAPFDAIELSLASFWAR